VPAYVIAHDRTLRELARLQPRSVEELAGIHGMGPEKLRRHGREILAVLGGADPTA
jgi:ATP-dependent DNA helicase RecQ